MLAGSLELLTLDLASGLGGLYRNQDIGRGASAVRLRCAVRSRSRRCALRYFHRVPVMGVESVLRPHIGTFQTMTQKSDKGCQQPFLRYKDSPGEKGDWNQLTDLPTASKGCSNAIATSLNPCMFRNTPCHHESAITSSLSVVWMVMSAWEHWDSKLKNFRAGRKSSRRCMVTMTWRRAERLGWPGGC